MVGVRARMGVCLFGNLGVAGLKMHVMLLLVSAVICSYC